MSLDLLTLWGVRLYRSFTTYFMSFVGKLSSHLTGLYVPLGGPQTLLLLRLISTFVHSTMRPSGPIFNIYRQYWCVPCPSSKPRVSTINLDGKIVFWSWKFPVIGVDFSPLPFFQMCGPFKLFLLETSLFTFWRGLSLSMWEFGPTSIKNIDWNVFFSNTIF